MDNLPITPEPVSPSPFKTNSKLVPVLLTLFVLTLISLIAILYYQNQQLKSLLNQNENQPAPVPTSIPPTPTPDPTDNWTTYKDVVRENPTMEPEFAFEFKYPPTWMTEGRPNTDKVFWVIPEQEGYEVPAVMTLEIDDSDGHTIEEQIKRDVFPYNPIKKINNNINDILEGVIVSEPATMGGEHTLAFFLTEDKIFTLTINSDPPKLDEGSVILLDKILSTFQITK